MDVARDPCVVPELVLSVRFDRLRTKWFHLCSGRVYSNGSLTHWIKKLLFARLRWWEAIPFLSIATCGCCTGGVVVGRSTDPRERMDVGRFLRWQAIYRVPTLPV